MCILKIHSQKRRVSYATFYIIFLTFCGFINKSVATDLPSTITKDHQLPTQFIEKLSEIYGLIQKHYVHMLTDAQKQIMLENALRGMIHSLDAHAFYWTKGELQNFLQSLQNNSSGIGVNVHQSGAVLSIISVEPQTPAYDAGIRPCDEILTINHAPISKEFHENVQRLHAEPNAPLHLTLRKSNGKDVFNVSIPHVQLNIPSVQSRPYDKILYIRIRDFDINTAPLLRSILLSSKNQMHSIVLDLRNNMGGLFNQAIEVSNLFLTHGRIVSKRGAHIQEHVFHADSQKTVCPDTPTIVLINGCTASSAEIVAAALQDHQRAIVLGETSFGKGTVQTVFRLKDGDGIKLSTTYDIRPNGHMLQKHGVTPDVPCASNQILTLTPDLTVPISRENKLDGALPGDGVPPTSIKHTALWNIITSIHKNDPQLATALSYALILDIASKQKRKEQKI